MDPDYDPRTILSTLQRTISLPFGDGDPPATLFSPTHSQKKGLLYIASYGLFHEPVSDMKKPRCPQFFVEF